MGASLCRLCARCFGGKAGSDGDARNIFHSACWPLSPGRSGSLHWAAGLSAQWICSEVAGAEALGSCAGWPAPSNCVSSLLLLACLRSKGGEC